MWPKGEPTRRQGSQTVGQLPLGFAGCVWLLSCLICAQSAAVRVSIRFRASWPQDANNSQAKLKSKPKLKPDAWPPAWPQVLRPRDFNLTPFGGILRLCNNSLQPAACGLWRCPIVEPFYMAKKQTDRQTVICMCVCVCVCMPHVSMHFMQTFKAKKQQLLHCLRN